MNANQNNQPQPAKKIWLAPELTKIAVRDTEAGPFQFNPESAACQPMPPTPS